MKSLVVTYFHIPMSRADKSGKVRRFEAFLRALQRLSDEIVLLHIVPADQIAAAGPLKLLSASQSALWGMKLTVDLAPRQTRRQTVWSHYGAGIFGANAQPALFPFAGEEAAESVAAHLDRKPDLVFAQGLPAMMPILRSGRRPRNLMLDLDDIDHKVRVLEAFSRPRYPGKPAGLLQLPALVALERRAVAAARLAFVCTEPDRLHMRRLGFGQAVRVVPNALPLPPSPPGVVGDPTVLFVGYMAYPPNALAAERMARRIWPRVRGAIPGARLMIAGGGSDRLPSAGAKLEGVQHLGFVDDLTDLYGRARVVCCPLADGTGTRLKLVEAASYARPIVSTRIGAKGLGYTDGQHALLRDDDSGFAEACITLLRDDALCRRLGEAARLKMAISYDVRRVEARIASMIKDGCSRDAQRRAGDWSYEPNAPHAH